jgi:hypothetical protein
MSTNRQDFRKLAAQLDQAMQRLAAEGVNDPPAIINRMMGNVPVLHQIWTGTSDAQLLALSREFPGFYRYAQIMEDAASAEREKPSRAYDGIAPFSPALQEQGGQLLTTAAALERGYQALRSGQRPGAPPRAALDAQHQQWLADLDHFQRTLQAQGVAPLALDYVHEAFSRFVERLQILAG